MSEDSNKLLITYAAYREVGYSRLTSEVESQPLARAWLDSGTLMKRPAMVAARLTRASGTKPPTCWLMPTRCSLPGCRASRRLPVGARLSRKICSRGQGLSGREARGGARVPDGQPAHPSDKKRQLDELSEKNQLLLLQHTVSGTWRRPNDSTSCCCFW